jgi:2-polyprenyl-6-methoxyphenol hydroxylase-like FAD-dependent oxidoreductase
VLPLSSSYSHQEKMSLSSPQSDAFAAAPPVLIVGAGPAGLFAACELVRHGVKPRVVEHRLEPHRETRGTALQPAVLDIIDRGGLIEPFLRAGVRIRQIQLLGPGLHEIASTAFAGIGCQYEFQCSLPQWRTEAILREHLQNLGVKIEYGTEVKSIEDDPGGLRVRLDAGGRSEVFTVAYVLGAGGAHSVTRHSMQEHLDGETYAGRFIVADLKLRLPCPPECGRIIVGPTGYGLFSPLPDDRWLIFVNREEADTRSELPTADELSALLNARIGVDAGLHDLRWVSYFKMHKRASEALSDGRRFLLGDAGHLSSPLGGEGINAAFMDGADIAWKLALVVRGAARPSLLASYADERGAADHHVLEVSDEIHNFVMELIAMCDGGRTPTLPPADPAADLAVTRRRSMLDISYAGSALIGHAGAVAGGQRRETASRPATAWAARATISSCSAPRRGWTISARAGTSSSRLWMLQAPNSTRTRPAFPTAALSSCGRTASSGSALRPPTRRQWPPLMLTWRLISCPTSARSSIARPPASRPGTAFNASRIHQAL